MYEINSNCYFNEDKQKYGQIYNLTNQFKTDRTFNTSLQKENQNTTDTTFNNINQTNYLSSFERYKNQQLLNKAKIPLVPCNCNCHINSTISQQCNHCHLHHFHIHHIHISREQFNNYFTINDNTSEMKNVNNSFTNSNNLLKEVTELRNECKKFKEELERSNNENGAGAKYIRELENKINLDNNEEKNNNINNNINNNKYHDMLDKSFEVLNSVSKKCNDVNAKTKGGVYYYMNKDPDYNKLIQAQKNWIDNLPENNKISSILPNFNNSISKTSTINDQNEDDQNYNNFNNILNNSKVNNRNHKNQIDNKYKMNNNNPYNLDNSNEDIFKINNRNQKNISELNDDYYRNNLNNQIRGINDNKNPLRYYFDSQKNNNKGYIIKKGDKSNNKDNNNNDNNNENNNSNNNYNNNENNNSKNNYNNNENNNSNNNSNNNYNTSPNFNNKSDDYLNLKQIEDFNNGKNKKNNNTYPNNDIMVGDNNIDNNFNNNEEEKQNNNKEEFNTALNDKSKKSQPIINQDKNDENSLNINNNNDNEEDEPNPLNDRYLILDEKGNPIIRNGENILGMELIPLIGENGKEVIDDNGNIILIGPDGKPKSQDELEPIILDNDKPLVNEDNKPFLGLNGVPLINGEGNPILGPGELYDNDNNKVEGQLGLVAKDKMGNPIKVKINDDNNDNNDNKANNQKKMNNNNDNLTNNNNSDDYKKNLGNIKIEESPNVDNTAFLNKYRNLRPLIGPDGKPIKDSNNKHILLDENNNPVNDTGISLLLDQSGKPILNALGMPILLDINGKPINADNTIQSQKLVEKPFIAYKNNLNPPKEHLRSDGQRIGIINKNNTLNSNRQNLKDKKKRGSLNYSECNPDSLKKINFMRPYDNPFYDDSEYKVNCFACNLGCSVSKSGYSPMNFSPYNNLIRRRDITPLRTNNGLSKINKKSTMINLKKINMGNDNNFYLTEG